jgi:hypothetical protein
MKIYEVVSGGTKQNYPPGGEDWCVLVAAESPDAAREYAYTHTEIGVPWVVYEIAPENENIKLMAILRNMYESCPASNFGWPAFYPDPSSEPECIQPKLIESSELSWE